MLPAHFNRERLAATAGLIVCSLIAVMLAALVTGWSLHAVLLASLSVGRRLEPWFGFWPVVSHFLPLILLGLLIGRTGKALFHGSPAVFILVPSIVVWLTYAPMTLRGWETSFEDLILFTAWSVPFLVCLPFYLHQKRKQAQIQPVATGSEVSLPARRCTALERLLYAAIAIGNAGGVLLTDIGINNLKSAEWPPFNTGLFEASCVCIPPPDWLVPFWNSSEGHLIMWSVAIAVIFLGVIPWQRATLRAFWWPTFAICCAISGLLGFWIWSDSVINALPFVSLGLL